MGIDKSHWSLKAPDKLSMMPVTAKAVHLINTRDTITEHAKIDNLQPPTPVRPRVQASPFPCLRSDVSALMEKQKEKALRLHAPHALRLDRLFFPCRHRRPPFSAYALRCMHVCAGHAVQCICFYISSVHVCNAMRGAKTRRRFRSRGPSSPLKEARAVLGADYQVTGGMRCCCFSADESSVLLCSALLCSAPLPFFFPTLGQAQLSFHCRSRLSGPLRREGEFL